MDERITFVRASLKSSCSVNLKEYRVLVPLKLLLLIPISTDFSSVGKPFEDKLKRKISA